MFVNDYNSDYLDDYDGFDDFDFQNENDGCFFESTISSGMYLDCFEEDDIRNPCDTMYC